MQIRTHKREDQAAIIDLHNIGLDQTGAHKGPGPWDDDLQNIENVYDKNNGAFLVGELNGKIIAMGALRRISDAAAEIKRMRVLPAFQRQGFGQAMLTALEDEARGKKYVTLHLDTSVSQVAAQTLYLQNGYVETKRIMDGSREVIFYEKHIEL